MKIGLVPLSAKPYHAGHDALVKLATNSCDEVYLFVSTSDRKRKGELWIKGSSMKRIWECYIEPSLPVRVNIKYDCTPVKEVYVKMGEADELRLEDVFYIYSDEDDIKTYSDTNLKKYVPFLYERRLIERVGVSRKSTVEISGSEMRNFLKNQDFESFRKFLPENLQPFSQKIIDILLQD